MGLSLWTLSSGWAQSTTIEGKVIDVYSGKGFEDVEVQLEGTLYHTRTASDGTYRIQDRDLPLGDQILVIKKEDYRVKRIPVVLEKDQTRELGTTLLELDLSAIQSQIGIISLSEEQLMDDQGDQFNIAGLLQSTRDVFLNTAAFEFSATFFRPRGLDNAYGKVLINGIEMNKQLDGRPQWANWGGLNDVLRNREFYRGLKPNDYGFGDLAGTSYIDMRASQYRKGGRLSFAMANRSYQGRLMGTYSTGLGKSGWASAFSVARRFGTEAFVEGNSYSANSFFASVEKRLSEDHSFNFLAIYTPNKRGRSTALTQEVRDLKNIRYNPNWGYQDGRIRNSRMRRISEPIFILSHNWNLSDTTLWNTSFGFQTGQRGNTRIDNGGTRLVQVDGQDTYLGGGRNPLPNYYQRLPSYFLRDPNPSPHDFQLAYLAEQAFLDNGQVDWTALYRANGIATDAGGNSVYVVQEDRTDDRQFSFNSVFSTDLSQNMILTANLHYRDLRSENFARIDDLLGGEGYLDVDFFAEDDVNLIVEDLAQSDLRNKNRIAFEGERYKYNYELSAQFIEGFGQVEFQNHNLDSYLGLRAGRTVYQRDGLYENGNFPGSRSFGKSKQQQFNTYSVKAGLLYKASGRHLIDANIALLTKAPHLRNTFGNPRQNNDIIQGAIVEKIRSVDLSYLYRSTVIEARISGYYIAIEDQNEIGFYFTENISGLGPGQNAFIQEITTGIETDRAGIEIGVEAQISPTIKLRAVGSIGQYRYTNNPNLYITSDDFQGNLTFGDGSSKLKGYHLASGPERAFNLGFEYRDPSYWWFGISGNRYSNAYIDVNNLARTANFTSDFDGQPFNDYDPEIARDLLEQEQFHPYYLLNVVGGKSWRIRRYYVGFFATISNVLDQEYTTGGFEQGRYATYRDRNTDQNRRYGSLFGPRYFFGYGSTYYFNIYFQF